MIGIPAKSGGAVARPIPRPYRLNSRVLLFVAFLGALIWALLQAGIGSGKELVNSGGWGLVWRFVSASVQPDLSADILALAIPSMLTTLAFAVCGTAIALAIGVIGGVLSSEVWWQSCFPERARRAFLRRPHLLPWVAVRGVLAVPRAIHEVIWGLFFLNILGLDPLVAIFAIGIPFGAITAKVFADILDETPRASLHTLLNSGVTPMKALLYAHLPQAFPDLLSYGFYRLECAIRSAAVLGLIGAGGLGFQILLSLQSLKYEQVWTFLYFLILLSGLTDAWSSLLHRRLHTSRHGESKVADLPARATRAYSGEPFARFSMVALLLLVPLSFWYVQADFSKLFAPRASMLFSQIAQDSFPPNLDPGLLGNLLSLSAQTLAMSVLAMTIAGVGGLLLSFPAATNFALPGSFMEGERKSAWKTARGVIVLLVSRGFLLLSRALSEGIWALLALFVLFPGILPGAIGLGLYNLGVLGRLMSEVTENVDKRPLLALKGQGATDAQVFLYGVLPQTLSKNLAYILYRWEVCVRATVVVGLVGAGGLGRLLDDQLASFDYRSVLTSLIFYVVLTFLVDIISAVARRIVR